MITLLAVYLVDKESLGSKSESDNFTSYIPGG